MLSASAGTEGGPTLSRSPGIRTIGKYADAVALSRSTLVSSRDVAVAHPDQSGPWAAVDGHTLVTVSARIGDTRLIDSIEAAPMTAPLPGWPLRPPSTFSTNGRSPIRHRQRAYAAPHADRHSGRRCHRRGLIAATHLAANGRVRGRRQGQLDAVNRSVRQVRSADAFGIRGVPLSLVYAIRNLHAHYLDRVSEAGDGLGRFGVRCRGRSGRPDRPCG